MSQGVISEETARRIPFQCPDCGMSFYKKNTYFSHTCIIRTNSQYSMMDSNSAVSSTTEEPQRRITRFKMPNFMQCSKCDVKFKTYAQYSTHSHNEAKTLSIPKPQTRNEETAAVPIVSSTMKLHPRLRHRSKSTTSSVLDLSMPKSINSRAASSRKRILEQRSEANLPKPKRRSWPVYIDESFPPTLNKECQILALPSVEEAGESTIPLLIATDQSSTSRATIICPENFNLEGMNEESVSIHNPGTSFEPFSSDVSIVSDDNDIQIVFQGASDYYSDGNERCRNERRMLRQCRLQRSDDNSQWQRKRSAAREV